MISNLKFTQASKKRGCVIQLQEELIPTEVPCDKPQASQWHQSCLNLGLWVDLERESLGGQWPGAGRDPDVEKDRPLLLIDQSAPPTPNLVHLNLILPHFSDCTHTHQQIQIQKRMKIQKLNAQGQLTIPYTLI